jgi:hypothetical protein
MHNRPDAGEVQGLQPDAAGDPPVRAPSCQLAAVRQCQQGLEDRGREVREGEEYPEAKDVANS